MAGETNGHVNTTHVLITHIQLIQVGQQGQSETLGSHVCQNPTPTATIQTQARSGGESLGIYGPPDGRKGLTKS